MKCDENIPCQSPVAREKWNGQAEILGFGVSPSTSSSERIILSFKALDATDANLTCGWLLWRWIESGLEVSRFET